MLNTGFEVDRYVVEEKLGEGGMAVVYRVRHSTLGTRHALKVLSIASRDVKERLIQEGRVQATLAHPNIVGVTDVLDVDGSPGLLMEFIQGPALDHWLFHYQPSVEEAVTLFRGIVAGVGHAHEKGLIHRDLKPGNVMLHIDERGIHPKVTDFGLAKLSESTNLKRTRTGTTMGTPAYMAPEQIRDASAVDRRADLYSLGVILYELVCGRTPYQETDIIELFAKVAAGDYPHPRELRPDLPNNVCDVIDGLIEVNRDFRLNDCASILEILDGADKDTFTTPIEIDTNNELPPPRVMKDPGVTHLAADTMAASAAKKFVNTIVTPPPVDRIGSLAPRAAGSRLDFDDEPDTTNLQVEPLPPVQRRSWLTTGLLMVMTSLVVFLFLSSLTMAGALFFNLNTGPTPVEVGPTLPEPALPDPTAPDPTAPEPGTSEDPEPGTKPEPENPEPVENPTPVAPSPSPVRPTPKPVRPRPVKPRPTPPKPAATPDPEPVGTATASFTYNQDEGIINVLLFNEAGTEEFKAGDPMEPGRYKIWLYTLGEKRGGGAGSVLLKANTVTPLQCDTQIFRCVQR